MQSITAKELISALKGLPVKDSWQEISKCDILLVRHDNNCGYNYRGKAYSHLLDTIGEIGIKRNLKVSSVATPFSKLTLDKAFNSPVSFNQAIIFAEIKRRCRVRIKGDNSAREKHNQFKINLWAQILEKAKPKVVIGIQPDEYLCAAGKLKNIPIFDFQHGVISDGHSWYGEKYCSNKALEKIPDGFLCWDEQAVETLSKWTKDKGITVLNVGNPWFSRFIYPQKEDKIVQNAFAESDQLFDQRPCILVSLQWGLKKLHPNKNNDGTLVPELKDVIKDTINDYNWLIRLHPVQMRGDESRTTKKYLIDNFGPENTKKWLTASELPLPIILTRTDLHITYYSTVVIESAWVGIKSGLLSEELYEKGQYQNYYQYERELGLADILPHDTEEIKNWITVSLKEGKKKAMFADTTGKLNAFFETIKGINCRKKSI